MNSSILTAIESLCDDIATNTEAEDNRKRAEAVLLLATSDIFTHDDEDDTEDKPADDPDYEGEKLADNIFGRVAEAAARAMANLRATAAATETDSAKLPKQGEHFEYKGLEFVALGKEGGGLLAVAAKTLAGEYPFDKEGRNDWRSSTLRKQLNEEFIKHFDKGDLLPYVSDLTADDGMKDYGTAEDYVFLLSCDLYRKYREFMPKYDNWVWTITPWSCLKEYAGHERGVLTVGTVNSHYAIYAYAVAPACIFNPAIFK